ncbi:MAG: hypothetical protein OXK77_08590 [Gemmatimonadota bacterium]|nr:hypothetical protein [Gemmatimonadota bacterium]MYB05159.1 hypothetical protein [Gemmatimonadota bacterium]MYE16842.1 hypothetical protein [Gemmatimonadota bacterium]MYG24176.1 hypothetical protein [Gemmatimonadota bacterium]MYJ37930.1 hypothetical protein [Gemmatimonadota bacterium]
MVNRRKVLAYRVEVQNRSTGVSPDEIHQTAGTSLAYGFPLPFLSGPTTCACTHSRSATAAVLQPLVATRGHGD